MDPSQPGRCPGEDKPSLKPSIMFSKSAIRFLVVNKAAAISVVSLSEPSRQIMSLVRKLRKNWQITNATSTKPNQGNVTNKQMEEQTNRPNKQVQQTYTVTQWSENLLCSAIWIGQKTNKYKKPNKLVQQTDYATW